MKKRLLVIALLLTVLSLSIAGTIAYLTDKNTSENVYTVGNVKIELVENKSDDNKLIPATGSFEDGTLRNDLQYEVYVKNIGSEDCYVRVQIAVAKILDGKLHMIHINESEQEGQWQWDKVEKYSAEIDGIEYDIYVLTYQSSMSKSEITSTPAISIVYLDSQVTSEDITAINEALSENWQIKVIAEATQAAGFDSAIEALNQSFGEAGSYNPFK